MSGGVATCATTALAVGSQAFTAVYSGGQDFNPSTSTAINRTVAKAATTTVEASSDSTTTWNAPVTYTCSAGFGSVVADYNGDGTFATSTVTVAQTVSRSFSRTLMTSSRKRSPAGEPVTFRVVVASDGDGVGTPTGLVSLYRVRDNSSRAWIGRGNLRAGGITRITVSDLPIGSYKIVAEYRGTTLHRPSTRSMTQTVHA